MRIGISTWDDRISPLFDTSTSLLVVEVAEGREVSREVRSLPEAPLPERARELANWGIEVLLCGAISRPLAGMAALYGIQLIPWLSGNVEEVLAAFLGGQFSGGVPDQRFAMPGCCRRRGRLGRGRGRGRR